MNYRDYIDANKLGRDFMGKGAMPLILNSIYF